MVSVSNDLAKSGVFCAYHAVNLTLLCFEQSADPKYVKLESHCTELHCLGSCATSNNYR